MIVLFITAMLVSIIFERQERRHTFYESLEYKRMGKTMPEPEPKLPPLESWLFTVLGIFICALGLGMIWAEFIMARSTPLLAHNPRATHEIISGTLDFAAGLAAGIALTIHGMKSVRMNRRLKSPP